MRLLKMPSNNQKIKISSVSYLNARPFIYGLKNSSLINDIKLSLDTPALCAEKLISGDVDLALVPVAAIPLLKKKFIVSDYCISAEKRVASVMLFSNVPIQQIERIYLDYQSKTSALLLKFLAKHHWCISPQWVDASEGYENKIKENIAGLIIGDRALLLSDKFLYNYDLVTEWNKVTHFPFTFACWVANKKLPRQFLNDFNNALRNGVNSTDKVVGEIRKEKIYDKIDLPDYFNNCIKYNFDEEKKDGVRVFLAFTGFGVRHF